MAAFYHADAFYLLQNASHAATIQSAGTNTWSNTSTWVGGVIPTSSDDVVIKAGHTVTLSDSRSCISVMVEATATLVLAGSLNNSGAFLNQGTVDWTGGSFTGTGSITNDGTLNANGGNNHNTATNITNNAGKTINWNDGHLDVSGGGQTLTNYGTFNLIGNNPSGFTCQMSIVNKSGGSIVKGGTTSTNLSISQPFTNEGGGTVTVNSGASLAFQTGGNITNDGTFNVGGTVNNTLSGTYGGAFNVASGATINFSNKSTNSTFSGTTFTNNGTVSVASGRSMVFGGAALQTLAGNGTSITALTINNASDLNITGSQTVTGALTFTAGKVYLQNGDLSVGSLSGATSNKYSVTFGTGRLMQLVGTSANAFPVGPSTASYNPVTLNQASGSDTYGVRVQTGFDYPIGGSDYVNRQWTIDRTPGNTTATTVALQWNSPADEQGVFVSSNCHVSRWTGSTWNSFGNGVASCGGTCTRTQSGITAFSPFGVASGTALTDCGLNTELCNGIDDNCNGTTDEGFPNFDGDGMADCVYPDDDNDGIADASDNCPLVSNASQTNNDGDGEGDACDNDDDNDGDPDATDCDDFNAAIHNGAAEVCNGIDDNCDGMVDEGFTNTDGDGMADCLDPDDDNDGVLDGNDNCPLVSNFDQANNDGDSMGDACDPDDDNDGDPDATDCEDFNAAIYTGAAEVCNGIDDDCDATVDEGFSNFDNDGMADCVDPDDDNDGDPDATDCDDFNSSVNQNATEACNGIDDDCDGLTDESFPNFDGDDVADCVDPDDDNDGDLDVTDCNDFNAAISHNATEACNGIDDDCDALTDEGFSNFDGDGMADCVDPDDDNDGDPDVTDCNDFNAAVKHGATEVCNGVDDDCDGVTDEGFANFDGDDLANCVDPDDDNDGDTDVTDCNDFNAAVKHGATEVCNNIDDDCDGLTDEGFDPDGDGIGSCNDNCDNTANPSQADSDCDGVGNACDVCPGGDDSVDNNNDGLPDCKYPPTFNQIITAWKCGNNNSKVSVCHNGGNTICISYSAVQAHINNHGDYIGPCGNAACNNGCGIINVPISQGAFETAEHLALEIFPNPASGKATFHLHSFDSTAAGLTIFDHTGRVVWQQTLEAGQQELTFDLTGETFMSGIYLVKINSRNEILTKRLVISK